MYTDTCIYIECVCIDAHRVCGTDLFDRDVDDWLGQHDNIGVLINAKLLLSRGHSGGLQEELPKEWRQEQRGGRHREGVEEVGGVSDMIYWSKNDFSIPYVH